MPGAPWPGAFHTVEIMYAFDIVAETFAGIGLPPSPEDEALGHRVSELWAHFAANHSAAWRQFSLDLEETVALDVSNSSQFTVDNNYRRSQCEALEKWTGGMITPGKLGGADMIYSALNFCQAGLNGVSV